VSAFRLAGSVGLAAALGFTTTLAAVRQLAMWPLLLSILVAFLTFLGLALAWKVATGVEQLTYYHHQIAVIVTTGLVLHMSGQQVLAYLDVIILGVGLFTAAGRVGCFLVGCCHGRPWHRGFAYGPAHVDAGSPSYLVGVRLLPVQLAESALLLALVGVGAAVALAGDRPGEALVWYVVAYAVGRFGLEFLRGDAARPYLLGFSEAQWTSVVLAWVAAAAGVGGLQPPWRTAFWDAVSLAA
jgi:hypothetical protein